MHSSAIWFTSWSKGWALFTPHIPMYHVHIDPLGPKPLGELLGHGHTAVLAAGTAHRKRHVVLVLPLITGKGQLEHLVVGLQHRLCALLREHVLTYRRVPTVHRPEFGVPVGIGQETAVHHQIGIHRKTVFETEGDHVGPWARLVALTEETDDSGLELVHVQLGGVDDQVGLAPDRKQGLSFASDPVGDASVTLQWVWSAHPLEPTHQGLVARLQEEHTRGDVALAQLFHGGQQILGEGQGAYVHHHRHTRHG